MRDRDGPGVDREWSTAVDLPSSPDIDELDASEWLEQMRSDWRQGEHVLLLGPTGSGKTYLAQPLLSIRDYVIVLAVKRHDDTLSRFKSVEPRYVVRSKWPPNYNENRVVIWIKAENIDKKSVRDQAMKVYGVLNHVYKNGGWCVFVDDTGYTAGTLGLADAITVLLSQARSSYISVVAAMTQASSVLQRVPTETMRQVRHLIIFYYEDKKDIDAVSHTIGKTPSELHDLMDLLDTYPDGSSDFLHYDRVGRRITLVRNGDLTLSEGG